MPTTRLTPIWNELKPTLFEQRCVKFVVGFCRSIILLICVIFFAAACQPQAVVLPTDANIAFTQTVEALAQQTPTATSTRTLPPTFTPTFTPSATPSPVITATPLGFSELGTLFYLYNGDAVASVRGDGTENQIVLTFGVGQPISDLMPSPDARLLAFVGPSGANREVFITSRDGLYLQRISCLGFADVRRPQWSPDGTFLTFFAAPQPGAPGGIYKADVANAGNCPQNDQRLFVATNSTEYGGAAWNADASLFFYTADGPLMALNVANGQRQPIARGSANGPDFYPLRNPVNNGMAFLQTIRDQATRLLGGGLVIVNDTSSDVILDGLVGEQGSLPLTREVRWNADGDEVLLLGRDSISVRDIRLGAVTLIAEDLNFPSGDYGPNDRFIAYTAPDENGVPQIFAYDRRRERAEPLTENPEGTISDVFWLAG